MVRLKVYLYRRKVTIIKDFNSNMVRLKDGKGVIYYLKDEISIPIWFD